MEAAFKSSFCDPTISHNSNQGTCWQCALFFLFFLKHCYTSCCALGCLENSIWASHFLLAVSQKTVQMRLCRKSPQALQHGIMIPTERRAPHLKRNKNLRGKACLPLSAHKRDKRQDHVISLYFFSRISKYNIESIPYH